MSLDPSLPLNRNTQPMKQNSQKCYNQNADGPLNDENYK